jgi:hypothetical protein
MSKITRICDMCGKVTEYQKLLKDKRKKDGVRPRCRPCENSRFRLSEAYINHKKYSNSKYKTNIEWQLNRRKQIKEYRVKNKVSVMLEQARVRAKRKNAEFTISVEDITIPEYCPLLNIKLESDNIARRWNSPSLDRIDNTKSYVKGNVRVISYLANSMKTVATLEQLRLFAKNIGSYIGDDDIVQPIEKENL